MTLHAAWEGGPAWVGNSICSLPGHTLTYCSTHLSHCSQIFFLADVAWHIDLTTWVALNYSNYSNYSKTDNLSIIW